MKMAHLPRPAGHKIFAVREALAPRDGLASPRSARWTTRRLRRVKFKNNFIILIIRRATRDVHSKWQSHFECSAREARPRTRPSLYRACRPARPDLNPDLGPRSQSEI